MYSVPILISASAQSSGSSLMRSAAAEDGTADHGTLHGLRRDRGLLELQGQLHGVALHNAVVVAHGDIDFRDVLIRHRGGEVEFALERIARHRLHRQVTAALVVDAEGDVGVDGIFEALLGSGGAFVDTVATPVVVHGVGGFTGGAEDVAGTHVEVEVDTAAVGLFLVFGVARHDGHGHFLPVAVAGVDIVVHLGLEVDTCGAVEAVGHLGDGVAVAVGDGDAGAQGVAVGILGALQAVGMVLGVEADAEDFLVVDGHVDGHEEGAVTGGHVLAAEEVVVVAQAVGIVSAVSIDGVLVVVDGIGVVGVVARVVDIFGALVGVLRHGPSAGRQRVAFAVDCLEHNPVVAVFLLTVDDGFLPHGGAEVPVIPVGGLLEGLAHLAAGHGEAALGADEVVAVGLAVAGVDPFLVVVARGASALPDTVEVEDIHRLDLGVGGSGDVELQVPIALDSDMREVAGAVRVHLQRVAIGVLTRGVESHGVFPVVIVLVLQTIRPP